MEHANAENDRSAAQRAIRLHEENKALAAERDRLAAENAELRKEIKGLRELIDVECIPNRNPASRGAFEFYVCENWMFIRDCALDDENVGMNACITKRRDDPDDERVRIRRIRDDDVLLGDLAAANATLDRLREAFNDHRKKSDFVQRLFTILYPAPTETPDEDK